jgi:hypothetical protein
MTEQLFTAGDRVRTVTPTAYVRVGMVGTVQEVYLFDRVLYDVRFDSNLQPRLIPAYNLERIDDAPPTEWPA